MNLLTETVKVPVTVINKAAAFAGDAAAELLGVGYIIGLRTSSVMMAGAVLGYLVIIPVVYFAGIHSQEPIPPADVTVRAWAEDAKVDLIKQLRNNYLLYIGAGCVASAGLISMSRTLPMIVRSARAGMTAMRGGAVDGAVRRTENDMSMS